MRMETCIICQVVHPAIALPHSQHNNFWGLYFSRKNLRQKSLLENLKKLYLLPSYKVIKCTIKPALRK